MASFELPRIINAAGHLSMLGGGVSSASLAADISRAIERAMTRPVDMAWLRDRASERIAAVTGAEAGCVTSGAAAGIALSVAACVAGADLAAVHALPGPARARVALQWGHDIDFGAPVVQMIGLAGGEAVLAGTEEEVTPEALDSALEGASAMLFVQSHHVRADGPLPLNACVAAAARAGVPLIVDAAAEENLRGYVAAGASLVVYSGGKALGGLSSSGFVCGRADLIAAMRAQDRGIGRAMKVGPEQIIAICLALDAYGESSDDSGEVLRSLESACESLAGASFAVVLDEAGRDIRRLEVRTSRAAEVARALRQNEPPIFVRAHHVAEGRFSIDPRNLSLEDVPLVVVALGAALGAGREES